MSYKKNRGVAQCSDFRFRDSSIKSIPEQPLGPLMVGSAGDYKRWPDVIMCGPIVPFLVSERVVNDLGAGGVQVKVGPVIMKCTVGPLVTPPPYFYVCLSPGIEFDMNVPKIGLMQPIKPETWSKDDLCTTIPKSRSVFCSFRVMDIARRCKWTNVQFILPPGILTAVTDPVRYIDHLAPAREWPPQWLGGLLE